MTATLVYTFVPYGGIHQDYACRFVSSVVEFPPLHDLKVLVVVQGGYVSPQIETIFCPIPDVEFLVHNNMGWDIGAHMAAAATLKTDAMLCCGESVYFHRQGWMSRLAEAWKAHGEGYYGIWASYENRPHICTTAFFTSAALLLSYKAPVASSPDRYQFEHGPGCFYHVMRSLNKPCLLVTWDGEWPEKDWRKPPNIFRRGDQTNCLAWNNHTDNYRNASSEIRRGLEVQTGG